MSARFLLCGLLIFLSNLPGSLEADRQAPEPTKLPWVTVSPDKKRFVLSTSGSEFQAWGVNYDHDADNRLLEDYWETQWDTVKEDFAEMKALGANCVRIHLQVGKFMRSAKEPNVAALVRLAQLVDLAAQTALYLDVTGLGCYEKDATPQWYSDLNEQARWEVQARFWEAVARTCRESPAVFCYDLMNEPVVSEDKTGRDWTPGEFAGKYFVQRLTVDFKGRSEKEIAEAWVDRMVTAIRKQDKRHLITVGVIPWALTWPTAKPLFYSKEVSKHLDFVSVHFYPRTGEIEKALTALAVYDIGKPLVIEEMFPLNCSVEELDRFIEGSRKTAEGWIGFYWGKTIEQYQHSKGSISDSMALGWLEYFTRKAPQMRTPRGPE